MGVPIGTYLYLQSKTASSRLYITPIYFLNLLYRQEGERLKAEMDIADKNPFTTKLGEFDIIIEYEGFLTMVDGEVVNALTNCPSSQRCPFCHQLQSSFSTDIPFITTKDRIQFGLSTLHFGINAVKAILKIASQIEFKTHRCDTPEKHESQDRLKKLNAKNLFDKLGIRVEKWFMVDG